MEEQNPIEWDMDDEDLFRFVLEHSEPEPTFNLIASTSYHPTYSVDVEKKGFDPQRCAIEFERWTLTE